MSTSVSRIKNIEARSGLRDLYTGSGLFIATLDDPGPKSLPPPTAGTTRQGHPQTPTIYRWGTRTARGTMRAKRRGACQHDTARAEPVARRAPEGAETHDQSSLPFA